MLPNWPNITSNGKSQINRKLISDLDKLIKNEKIEYDLKLVYVGNTSLAHDYNSIIDFFNSFLK